ncbi:MAG TPA: hypothetical protein V6D48_10550 [Oculatellaceae cyanobacterium]
MSNPKAEEIQEVVFFLGLLFTFAFPTSADAPMRLLLETGFLEQQKIG